MTTKATHTPHPITEETPRPIDTARSSLSGCTPSLIATDDPHAATLRDSHRLGHAETIIAALAQDDYFDLTYWRQRALAFVEHRECEP